MSNSPSIPSFDDEFESSPESTPRYSDDDDVMREFYRPDLMPIRRNDIPVLTRRNANFEPIDSSDSDSTATTIRNNSYTSSDSDDLDIDVLFSRNTSNDESEQEQISDSTGGKLRRRHRTNKRHSKRR
jgi:hypothetical protein